MKKKNRFRSFFHRQFLCVSFSFSFFLCHSVRFLSFFHFVLYCSLWVFFSFISCIFVSFVLLLPPSPTPTPTQPSLLPPFFFFCFSLVWFGLSLKLFSLLFPPHFCIGDSVDLCLVVSVLITLQILIIHMKYSTFLLLLFLLLLLLLLLLLFLLLLLLLLLNVSFVGLLAVSTQNALCHIEPNFEIFTWKMIAVLYSH